MGRDRENYVAECFWPDVQEDDLATLDRRIERVIGELAPEHGARYLGSILLRGDEVVLCRFEGEVETIRDVAERAQIPCGRILAAANSPWSRSKDGGTR